MIFRGPLGAVFQIRRGGIKGLLVRYPDSVFDTICAEQSASSPREHSPPHYLIAYRPSMLKYKGGPEMLELNDHSEHAPPTRLNVPFIMLLLTLKVPLQVRPLLLISCIWSLKKWFSKVFERLLQDQLDFIGCFSHDREKAIRFISGELNAASDSFYQDCKHFPSCIRHLVLRN